MPTEEMVLAVAAVIYGLVALLATGSLAVIVYAAVFGGPSRHPALHKYLSLRLSLRKGKKKRRRKKRCRGKRRRRRRDDD